MKYFSLEPKWPERPSNPMTIVVAGGAGFLGSHLCERFLGEGHRVICVDNFQTGSRRNIAAFMGDPNFSLIEQDIILPLNIGEDIHQIYNMACAASPPGYQKNPIHTMMTNFIGVKNLLDLALAKNARILQSSTSEVYGDPEVSIQSESYRGSVNTCGPRACYDEGKRVAETLLWEYNSAYMVETRIVRIFNTYGCRMQPDDGRVVSNFIRQALMGEALTIYGDGSQTRSFCYVSDLIEGLVRLMASNETMPVNIGNPTEFTILELAQIVLRKTASESKIVQLPLPQDDPRQRRPDIGRAAAILGWSPKVTLEQGLEQMIQYFSRELFGDKSEASLVS